MLVALTPEALIDVFGCNILKDHRTISRKVNPAFNTIYTQRTIGFRAAMAASDTVRIPTTGPNVTFAKPVESFFELSIAVAPSHLEGEKHGTSG
jgi:hypothetical protein